MQIYNFAASMASMASINSFPLATFVAPGIRPWRLAVLAAQWTLRRWYGMDAFHCKPVAAR